MAELKCTMCGAKLNVVDGVTVVECEYCGTKQTVATSAVITSSLNKPQKSSGVNKAVIFSAAGCVSVLLIIIIALIISGNSFKLSNVGAYDDSSQITVEQYEKGDEHNNELKNNDNTSSVLSQLETPNSNPDNVSTPNTSVENDDNQVTSHHAQNPSNSQQTSSQSSQTPTTPSNPCASGHKWEEATCTTAARCSVCKKTSGSP